jgi:rifampin ADP-ribosylating transferase
MTPEGCFLPDESDALPFYHGTRASLETGEFIAVGHASNYGSRQPLSWVYFSQLLETAVWGAELAAGSEPQRIYIVEPTGPFFDDPNVTDKKFPGNPTRSFRSRHPLRIVGELRHWTGHSAEQLQRMKDGIAALHASGRGVIID